MDIFNFIFLRHLKLIESFSKIGDTMESLSIEGMGLDLGKLMKTFNSEL